ncbi:hypothetical protein A3K64_04275 [Candidatus Micrarchaeota archaeon RBG_16_36_9]|nr:MAG: hypothetical protein A3K64_04275 [Candidatus Micrarchaeota archaeon RBG_16_36_9]
MKKQVLLIAVFLIVMAMSSQVYAQQNYWHSSDRYGVELDGEGDAFVVAILTFEGLKENTNIYNVNLQIPGTGINVLKAIQTTDSYYSSQGSYQQGQSSFITYSLNELSDSTIINLNLKTSIIPNQRTIVVLIYQSQSIAKQALNGLEFNFQTIKDSNAMIRDVGANVYVPSNMQLKGKPNFNIQYSPSVLAGTFSATASVSYDKMSEYISYYRQSSQFSAQNLDPGESFTVKGIYGDNIFLLYIYEILELIVAILFAILVFKHFRLTSRIKNSFKLKNNVAPVQKIKSTTHGAEFSWTRVSIAGVGSGFLYIIASLLIQFLTGLFQSFSSFSYLFPLVIILYIIIFLLPVIALFAPAVYLAKTFSWKEGLLCFIFGVITTVILLFVIATMFPVNSPIYY